MEKVEKISEETKQKIKLQRLNNPFPKDIIQRIINGNLNKIYSFESKQKYLTQK